MRTERISDRFFECGKFVAFGHSCLRAFLSSLRDFLFFRPPIPGLKAWAIFGSPSGTGQKVRCAQPTGMSAFASEIVTCGFMLPAPRIRDPRLGLRERQSSLSKGSR